MTVSAYMSMTSPFQTERCDDTHLSARRCLVVKLFHSYLVRAGAHGLTS